MPECLVCGSLPDIKGHGGHMRPRGGGWGSSWEDLTMFTVHEGVQVSGQGSQNLEFTCDDVSKTLVPRSPTTE